jgi:hypothetical protein
MHRPLFRVVGHPGTWILLATACGAPRATPTTTGIVPAVIQRTPVYLDSAGVASSTGQVRVAVRVAPRPTEALSGALVTLLDDQQRSAGRVMVNDAGVATFPRVPAGRYTVRVQRIGYDQFAVTIPVSAGCATDVETYLAMSFIGIEAVVVDTGRGGASNRVTPESPAATRVTGARATVTTCGNDA